MRHKLYSVFLMCLLTLSVSPSATLDSIAQQTFQARHAKETAIRVELLTLRQSIQFADMQKKLAPKAQAALMGEEPIGTARRLLDEHVNDVSTRAHTALHRSTHGTIEIINLFIAYKGDNTDDQILHQAAAYSSLLPHLRRYLAITDEAVQGKASIIYSNMEKIVEVLCTNKLSVVKGVAKHVERMPTKAELTSIVPLFLTTRDSVEELYLMRNGDGSAKYKDMFYVMSALNALEAQCLEWYLDDVHDEDVAQDVGKIGLLLAKYPKTSNAILFMIPLVCGLMPFIVYNHVQPATKIYEPTSNETVLAGYVNNLTLCLTKHFRAEEKLGVLPVKEHLRRCMNETYGWTDYHPDKSLETYFIKRNFIFNVLYDMAKVMMSLITTQTSTEQLQSYGAMLYANLTAFSAQSSCNHDEIMLSVANTNNKTSYLLRTIIKAKTVSTTMVSHIRTILVATGAIASK